MPAGVSSPARAFHAIGAVPRFVAGGAGARLRDVDGVEYIDYAGARGAMILGHADPDVAAAIAETAGRGMSLDAPTEIEVRFAETVKRLVPSMERLRCVASGTEAAMSAVRVARGFTGRDRIVKVDGGYHGHSDGLLPGAPGVSSRGG